MPKKEPVVGCRGVMDIPLGACLTHPTKRLCADLHEAVRLCNVARVGMARFWQRWHEDNPSYVPQQRTSYGEPKVNSRGEPVIEAAWLPQCLENAMLARGTELCPTLYAKIVGSPLVQEVMKGLKAKMPYNHTGKAKFVWEAIQMNERQLPNYAADNLPIPSGTAAICYRGDMMSSGGKATVSAGIDAKVRELGKDSCVIRFPIFSRQAGREQNDAICRLEMSGLSEGHKALIRRICQHKEGWVMSDSSIIRKEIKVGNKMEWRWCFRLVYIQPRKDLGLEEGNTATLCMDGPSSNRPFRISFGERVRKVGDSYPLKLEYERLQVRRRTIRYRRRHGVDVATGHGKKKALAALRPDERATQDMMKRFMWNLVREVIKFCTNNDCGTLHYREPTMPLRERSWFNRCGIPYNWTVFLGRLRAHCDLHGIALVEDRMGTREFFELYPNAPRGTPAQPRTHPTGVATLQFEEGKGKRGHQAAPIANGKVRRRAAK